MASEPLIIELFVPKTAKYKCGRMLDGLNNNRSMLIIVGAANQAQVMKPFTNRVIKCFKQSFLAW